MSQHPTSPEQPHDEEGRFVGGSFGRTADSDGSSDNAEDAPTTAQQIEAEEAQPRYLADVEAPAAAEEFVADPSGELDGDTGSATDVESAADSDVEGTGGEPAPGDLNEPV